MSDQSQSYSAKTDDLENLCNKVEDATDRLKAVLDMIKQLTVPAQALSPLGGSVTSGATSTKDALDKQLQMLLDAVKGANQFVRKAKEAYVDHDQANGSRYAGLRETGRDFDRYADVRIS